jgi:hypothetical protein
MSDKKRVVFLAITLVAVNAIAQMLTDRSQAQKERTFDDQISGNAQQLFKQGKEIFRFDTFGDEGFWGDTLKLHRAIEGSKFGGVGSGVSPKTALAVGLKVYMDAVLRQNSIRSEFHSDITLS